MCEPEEETSVKKPCRNCGTQTPQRAEGIPYCSISCINSRRRSLQKETLYCPYPECDWSHEWDPELGIEVQLAEEKIKRHREGHNE